MSAQYDKQAINKNVESLDVSPNLGTYTGVEIIVDEDTSYFAGDSSGRVITITNPWGTQTMANNILNRIRGFTYQPYTASNALLDPAMEIGDGVTINGIYSGLYKISKPFNHLMASDIEAPQDEEIDHEYPFESKENREIVRRFSAIESEFAIQSNQISAKVSQTGGSNSSFGWKLLSTYFSVYASNKEVFRIDSSGASVNGKITATSGKIGGFDIGSNAITYNGQTWNGSSKTGIYIGTSGIQLGKKSSSTGYFQASATGTIEARNLKLTGTLNIGGTNIDASVLRSGAQSAYSNGGTWSTGAGYGYNYNNATKESGGSYPSYYRAGRIEATTRVIAPELYIGGFHCRVMSINDARFVLGF